MTFLFAEPSGRYPQARHSFWLSGTHILPTIVYEEFGIESRNSSRLKQRERIRPKGGNF